jgi:hypothetical protein
MTDYFDTLLHTTTLSELVSPDGRHWDRALRGLPRYPGQCFYSGMPFNEITKESLDGRPKARRQD